MRPAFLGPLVSLLGMLEVTKTTGPLSYIRKSLVPTLLLVPLASYRATDHGLGHFSVGSRCLYMEQDREEVLPTFILHEDRPAYLFSRVALAHIADRRV